MSNNNNQLNIPQARESGSVGGRMVRNVYPGRTKKFERISRISTGYIQRVEYIATITI